MQRLPFDPDQVAGPEAEAQPSPRRPQGGRRPFDAEHLTVSQVAELIKSTFQQHVQSPLRVIGQVSNLSCSNHWYFSLKDEAAVLNCVAWASSAKSFGFVPAEGDEVIAVGHLSHYAPQGRTQLYVKQLKGVGAGALELRFRAMCEELRRLGYFDEARKRPLPVFPTCIAVITSASSAAWRDVMATAAQRCKAVRLLLVDVRVQGEGAAEQVAGAIRRIDRQRTRLGVDVILVTRGGGSAEDLWTFNERVVADAAFKCTVPVVAAIGHESDTTVIELVADCRAATPTQAVMRLVPAASQLHEQVSHLQQRLGFLLKRLIERHRHRFDAVARFELFRDPGSRLRQAREIIDGRHRDLRHGLQACIARRQLRFERLAGRLYRLRPEVLASRRREQLAVLHDRIGRALRRRVDQRNALLMHRRRLGRAVAMNLRRVDARLEAFDRQLGSIDPHRVLTRGYTYTMTADGRLIRSTRDVRRGQLIVTRVTDGSIESIVGNAGGRLAHSDPADASASQMDLFDRSR